MTRRAQPLASRKNDGKRARHASERWQAAARPSPSRSTASRSTSAKARRSGRWRSATASSSRICAIRPSPATARTAIAASAWWRSRASACWRASCIRTPTPGMKVKTQTDRAKTARRMVVELLLTDQPPQDVAHDPTSKFWTIGRPTERSTASRFPRRAHRRRPTAAIPRWRSISTPASSAISASAPAARCRSTTSSAWPAAATAKRSCSTSTIRWAPRPASPAANACRPARPAR